LFSAEAEELSLATRRNPAADVRMVATRQFSACFLVVLATFAILLATTQSSRRAFLSRGDSSRFEDQRCKEVKAQRPSNEDRRQDEAEHHEAVRQRFGAGRALRARNLARPVNQPVAV
jgi:hypothetical protein